MIKDASVNPLKIILQIKYNPPLLHCKESLCQILKEDYPEIWQECYTVNNIYFYGILSMSLASLYLYMKNNVFCTWGGGKVVWYCLISDVSSIWKEDHQRGLQIMARANNLCFSLAMTAPRWGYVSHLWLDGPLYIYIYTHCSCGDQRKRNMLVLCAPSIRAVVCGDMWQIKAMESHGIPEWYLPCCFSWAVSFQTTF